MATLVNEVHWVSFCFGFDIGLFAIILTFRFLYLSLCKSMDSFSTKHFFLKGIN